MSFEEGSDEWHEHGAGLAHLSSKKGTTSDSMGGTSATASTTVHGSSGAEKENRGEACRRRKKKSHDRDDGSHGHSSRSGGDDHGKKKKKKKKHRRPSRQEEYYDDVEIDEEQAIGGTFDIDMDIDEEQAAVYQIDMEHGVEHLEEVGQPEAWPPPPSPSPPSGRDRDSVSSAIGHMQPSASKFSVLQELSINLQLMIFFRQALFRVSSLLSVIIYSTITFIVLEVDGVKTSGVFERLNASKATVAFFSSFLGFSLVFRTNICYSRWWEGRCLWGALIFSAVNLAHQGKFCVHSRERYRRLCSLVVCFAYACKGQLSASSIEADSEHLLGKGIITPIELDHVTSRSGWQPYYFLTALRDTIQGDVAARPERNLFSFQSDLVTMDDSLRTLATSIGGLIRVKATGLPIAYDWLFNVIFIIFFTVATLAWAPTLGWYTPIIITVLNFVVHLIIGIGSALEDPFGDDITDLPLGKFCEAIAAQVEAIYHDEIPAHAGGGWLHSGASKGRDSAGQVILHRIGKARNRRSTAASVMGTQAKVSPALEGGRRRASASLARLDSIRPKKKNTRPKKK